jgi:hypothetical protein
MAFNNIPSTDLSRFSIGEIVDLSGVPSFYNAGSSKWLRSATATAASNLSATTRTNLANAGTAVAPTVLAQSALSLSYNSNGFYATYPIARISASSISVVPASNFTADVLVGVATSAGLQAVYTGQTSNRTSSNGGANGVVASNNTKIFSYCFTSASSLNVKSTTNGTTWTAESVSGTPTFGTSSTTQAHASSSQTNYNTAAFTTGWRRNKVATTEFAVFWCGARFLIIGPDSAATNYIASLSSDGFTFGGDNTTAVLGSAVLVVSLAIQFYRNGNNCYLQVGTSAKRYSTDGGITWAASTFAASPNPISYIMQYNTTDPAKLIIKAAESSDTAYYTADSGATWSANRQLPSTDTNGGLYYKGSTVITSNLGGIIKVSTNDGVTWATPTFPIGVLSQSIAVFADANRFYGGVSGQPQLLTSSDGVTWTIVTLSQNYQININTTEVGIGIITYPGDSNTVVLLGYNGASGANQTIFSLDGGVTWTAAQFTVSNTGGAWGVGNCFTTPDAGGVAFTFGMSGISAGENTNVLKADITTGGAFYRTGTSVIAPLRTNALSYVRVG